MDCSLVVHAPGPTDELQSTFVYQISHQLSPLQALLQPPLPKERRLYINEPGTTFVFFSVCHGSVLQTFVSMEKPISFSYPQGPLLVENKTKDQLVSRAKIPVIYRGIFRIFAVLQKYCLFVVLFLAETRLGKHWPRFTILCYGMCNIYCLYIILIPTLTFIICKLCKAELPYLNSSCFNVFKWAVRKTAFFLST